jgi:hypothetical protein
MANKYEKSFAFWLKGKGFEFHPDTVIINVDDIYGNADNNHKLEDAYQKVSRPKFLYSFWEGEINSCHWGCYSQFIKIIGDKAIYHLTTLGHAQYRVTEKSQIVDRLMFAEVASSFDENGFMTLVPCDLSQQEILGISLKTLAQVSEMLVPISRKNGVQLISRLAFQPLWSAHLPLATLERIKVSKHPVEYYVLHLAKEKPLSAIEENKVNHG